MVRKFNISRYKELYKLNLNTVSDEIFFELLGYRAEIESYICYSQKEKYFSLIENYLTGLIVPYNFRSQFLEIERQDANQAGRLYEDFQVLEQIVFADNLQIFSNLKIKISTLCFEYGEILDDGSGERMTESQFYASINICYFQLQKIFPVLSSINLPYEKLTQRSFNTLISIIGLEIILVLACLLMEKKSIFNRSI